MQACIEEDHGAASCQMEIGSAAVEAGGTIHLTGRVTFGAAQTPGTCRLEIHDDAGAQIGAAAVTDLGDQKGEAELVLPAPQKAGDYTWRAELVEDGERGGDNPGWPLSFTVTPQATRVLVWDVPATVETGTEFRVKVGVKASAGCPLVGTEVVITDAEARELARAPLSDATWPGSEALNYVEVALRAPDAPGRYDWRVVAPGSEDDVSRAEGSADFTVQCVPMPQHSLTVTAVDAETGAPIPAARVVMHPYRTRADADGQAVLRVVGGSYRLFVSAPNYDAVTSDVEVAGDLTTRAELHQEPPEDLARGYA